MAQALQELLRRYNHVLSNEPLGIQIKAKPPEKSSQAALYVVASLIGVFGLFLLVIGLLKLAYAVMGIGLLIAVNIWKRGESTSVRKVHALLIGAEDVTLSQGFRNQRISRQDVKDISIRQRPSHGQQEAQLYFLDAEGRQHESLSFVGISGQGLKESADRIADHIWNYVKTSEEDHRELGPLDLPDASQEGGERAPWG